VRIAVIWSLDSCFYWVAHGAGIGQLRAYKIFDLAGNPLAMVERVRRSHRRVGTEILSLQYGDGPVLNPARNRQSYSWSLRADGTLRRLQQRLSLGSGNDRQEWIASFDARENKTIIEQEAPRPERKLVKPGLVLLRLNTDHGNLTAVF
jgi:hypothetical protein